MDFIDFREQLLNDCQLTQVSELATASRLADIKVKNIQQDLQEGTEARDKLIKYCLTHKKEIIRSTYR